jgi:hypothetical protein
LDHTLTERGLESVLKAQKRVWEPAESTASKGGGLGVFIAPFEKLAIIEPLGHIGHARYCLHSANG